MSRRRSLSNTGGRSSCRGRPEDSRWLAECLDVDPASDPPYTHGFHPWPARMHPETARRALERFASPGAPILDPFMGSGTAAVEAVRAGLAFVGNDLSRVAVEVAWVRTRIWIPDRCRQVERAARRIRTDEDRGGPLPGWAAPEREWYEPHTLREICLLRDGIEGEEDPELRRVLLVVLSSIVVKLSRQASDSVSARDRFQRSRPPGAPGRMFREKAEELTGMLLRLSSDLHKRKVERREPDLRRGDARRLDLPASSVDLVLTSPPYPGTYDYALHHARRYPLWGEDGSAERAGEIGSRRGGSRDYRDDLGAVLDRIHPALAPGARVLFLVGDGAGIRADRLLEETAPSVGMSFVACAAQGRRRGRREHLILLERA